MDHLTVLSGAFAEAAAKASLDARRDALAAGHSVVFIDRKGRYIEEFPDGRRFEIRLNATRPRESHRVVIRELSDAD